MAVTHLAEMLHIARRPPVAANGAEGRRAVADAVARRGLEGTVAAGPAPGWYHVRYALRGRPAVTVVIPTRDRVGLLRACIESIEERSTYPERRLLVVDNGSTDPETLAYLASLPHRVIRDPRPFNYSELMNAAVERVDTEQVVLLNNDVTVITPGWLEAMLEHAQRPDVGAVGCRLLYPDGRPQHEGVAVGVGSPAINLDLSALPPMGRVIREVSAVTAACMMIRREVWREVGGMDETLRVAFNDVDLCLRLRRAGYRVVYTPLAELHHHESASRGDRRHDDDDVRFAVLWGHHRGVRDAFVNPHLEWVSPPRLRPS
jgi:GT2 family glycosyltransferase